MSLKISYNQRGIQEYVSQRMGRYRHGGSLYRRPRGPDQREGFRFFRRRNRQTIASNAYKCSLSGDFVYIYGMMGNLSTRTGAADEVYFAYDYRAFGELVSLVESADKVTENFTGKEKDDEIELNYFGARYLDPKKCRCSP